MKKFNWTLYRPEAASVKALSESINVSAPIATALLGRGVSNFQEAKAFFRPNLDMLHSPFLMKDMKKASGRVLQAVRNGEKILIYGDYDVDGTTGTAMLVLFLKKLGANVAYYVNDRHSEGYGISSSGIAKAKDEQTDLVISVDCGISAVEPVRFCNEHGIDFIICDHHEPSDLPDAYAILNPKLPDSGYPYRELCGCGVAFKLIQAVASLVEIAPAEVYAYLDYVALAIAADIVNLTGENRVMMAEGLKTIQCRPRQCLAVMSKVCGLDLSNVSSSQIVFSIAPRINAAGRLNHARQAIEWMIAEDEHEAVALAEELEFVNRERREIDTETFKEAEQLAEVYALNYASSIVLYKDSWHVGVIGIVASRILEKYYRPTLILTAADGVLKGSARSVQGVNVYEALQACEEFLLQFGGHEHAAGLTLAPSNLESFRKAFDRAVEEQFTIEMRVPEIKVDAEVVLEQITPNFFKVLSQFAPFGPKNPRPVFLTRNVKLCSLPQLLKEKHLKFSICDALGRRFDVVGFNMPEYFKPLQTPDRRISLVYSLTENVWNRRTSIQIRLRDLSFED
ncbi:single-stranded-DNA-specific exonuclease RecJ [Chloroherpeton thalassium ATCC 35110]|uniref:Single-stranded-DNA-specific exonuclease RecJ n=1 Tax=Chloroherpeton thalassium (strain ATCC 35110 / GB-78) TaxID=517418 RepID=B3QWF4_CHLT3|nr:single-stranded-DNA-specific exonuclease RecJ [Chloroherpeton thalassium]ACF14714.1 single-stranded-DNA-specific exonuclease RecJ [Chloroherpeton thalassium ATCC 35110]